MKGNPKTQQTIPRSVARAGILARQPVLWALITALLALLGGRRGRRAALKGSACFVAGAVAGNLPKPLFGRPQPRHRWARKPQVARGAFPSGHAAAEVAYVFGVSQEVPALFLPLSVMAMAAHLSLLKAGKHFVSDQLVGGALGIGIAALAFKAWPPHNEAAEAIGHQIERSFTSVR